MAAIEHELLTSEQVIKEFTRILGSKFKIPQAAVNVSIEYINTVAAILPVADTIDPPSIIPDPDDAPIIAGALAAGADVFVTGDKALLDLKTISGMAILSPREFWVRERGS